MKSIQTLLLVEFPDTVVNLAIKINVFKVGFFLFLASSSVRNKWQNQSLSEDLGSSVT